MVSKHTLGRGIETSPFGGFFAYFLVQTRKYVPPRHERELARPLRGDLRVVARRRRGNPEKHGWLYHWIASSFIAMNASQ